MMNINNIIGINRVYRVRDNVTFIQSASWNIFSLSIY